MKRIVFLLTAILVGGMVATANADILINEVVGNTPGTDYEFIELYNSGSTAIDIGGWCIELWDSDTGTAYGGSDASSPYTIATGTTIASAEYFLFANSLAESTFGVTADFSLSSNAIENSSYTMILKDSNYTTVNSIFITDGGISDEANDAGTAITPDFTIGPDGPYVPAGFYRTYDGADTVEMFDFDDIVSVATPGAANAVPVPAAVWLLGSGLLGLIGIRRKKA